MTDIDTVRLMIGDTSSPTYLEDAEIQTFLDHRTTGGTIANLPAAAADCAGAIAAQFARRFSFAEDGQRFDIAQVYGNFIALEQDLRRRQGGQSVPVNAGTTT